MSKIIPEIIPVFIFWTIFAYVIIQVPYPQSFTQANPTQLMAFFIPLFTAIALTLNLFLNNLLSSASISSGIIFFLILKGLDVFNFVTAIMTTVAIALLLSYFQKMKRKSLTKWGKIPKLTKLQNQPSSSRT